MQHRGSLNSDPEFFWTVVTNAAAFSWELRWEEPLRLDWEDKHLVLAFTWASKVSPA